MMNPLITAIVSTYKAERFMQGCLDDLVRQTIFNRMEVLVIDSASPENEGEIVKTFQKKHSNIRYVRTDEREGLYAAWNRAIGMARGRYVTNANTDDRHHPSALEHLTQVLENDHSVDLVCAWSKRSNVINQAFEDCPEDRVFKQPPFFAPRCLLHYQFGPQPVWRRSLHERLGLFDPELMAVGDYDFNIRFALAHRAFVLPHVLGSFFWGEDNITNAFSKQNEEKQAVQQKYRTVANVLTLYAREGWPVGTSVEQAAILNDMAMRAVSFNVPGGLNRESAPEFALHCFAQGLKRAPNCKEIARNLGILRSAQDLNSLHELRKKMLPVDTTVRSARQRRTKQSSHPVAAPNRLGAGEHKGRKIGILAQNNNLTFLQTTLPYLEKRHQVRILTEHTPERLKELTNWADAVWLEWADLLTAQVSHLPKQCRLVCRLHSYEAYLPYLDQINWKNIDTLVFVSDYLRRYVTRKVAAIGRETDCLVLRQGIDLDRFAFKKRRHGNQLAFVGHLIQTKNIALMLQAFSVLKSLQPDFELQVFGEFTQDVGISAEVPENYLRHQIRAMGFDECVTLHGHLEHDELIRRMDPVNYLISTSFRESVGLNIVEAMAMGIMPLVHNWPGAENVYPRKYLFNSILELPEKLETPYRSEEYRKFAEKEFDLTKLLPRLERLLVRKETAKTAKRLTSEEPSVIRSEKIKVAYLVHGDDVIHSGIIRNQVFPLLHRLHQRFGYEFILVSMTNPGFAYDTRQFHELQKNLAQSGIELVHLVNENQDMTARALGRLLKKRNVGLMHCRSYHASEVARAIGRRWDIPFVFDARGILPEETRLLQEEKRGFPVLEEDDPHFTALKGMEDDLIRESAATVVMNQTFKGHYLDQYPGAEGITVIPNFVDLESFSFSPKDRENVRREMGWERKKVFVYSGAFSPWYDLSLLGVWGRELLGRDNEALFLVLHYHDSTTGAENSRKIKEVVEAFGLDPSQVVLQQAGPDDVPRWLSASDVALIPHNARYAPILKVAQPVKFAEFLANGLPILLPEVNSAMVELMSSKNGSGWVLPSDGALPPETAQNILKDVGQRHKKDLIRIRSDISDLVQDRFALEKVARQYAELYSRVTENARGQEGGKCIAVKRYRRDPHKTNVLVYASDNPNYACSHIRCFQTFEAAKDRLNLMLGAQFVETYKQVINLESVREADIISLHRFFPRPDTSRFLDVLHSSGLPVVYETDDLLTAVMDDNQNHGLALQAASHIEAAMRRSDAVIVTTEELGKRVEGLNERVHIYPNFIDEKIWGKKERPKAPREQVVIGYAGTPTHIKDLSVMEEALTEISKVYGNKVVFRFWGCLSRNLSRLPQVRYQDFKLTYHAYAQAMQEIDVDFMLVPLLDNEFNRCKSNIKWLEYAASMLPGIYSDLPPYACIEQGRTGIKVANTTQAWFEAIDHLINNPNARRTLAESAYREVMDKHTVGNNAHRYTQILEEVMQHHREKQGGFRAKAMGGMA